MEAKVIGTVIRPVEELPHTSGLMTCRYWVREDGDPSGLTEPQLVKVLAQKGQAYWALKNLQPGKRVRLGGRVRALLSTLILEQERGRIL